MEIQTECFFCIDKSLFVVLTERLKQVNWLQTIVFIPLPSNIWLSILDSLEKADGDYVIFHCQNGDLPIRQIAALQNNKFFKESALVESGDEFDIDTDVENYLQIISLLILGTDMHIRISDENLMVLAKYVSLYDLPTKSLGKYIIAKLLGYCKENNLDKAQILYSIYRKYNLKSATIQINNLETLFVDCCKRGHLKIVKWLLLVIEESIQFRDYDIIYSGVLRNGWDEFAKRPYSDQILKVIKWICSNEHSRQQEQMLRHCRNKIFHRSCCQNDLLMVEWLFSEGCFNRNDIKQSYNILSFEFNADFFRACKMGNLDLAKLIYANVKSEIELNYASDSPLYAALAGNHQNVAKWLREIGAKEPIRSDFLP